MDALDVAFQSFLSSAPLPPAEAGGGAYPQQLPASIMHGMQQQGRAAAAPLDVSAAAIDAVLSGGGLPDLWAQFDLPAADVLMVDLFSGLHEEEESPEDSEAALTDADHHGAGGAGRGFRGTGSGAEEELSEEPGLARDGRHQRRSQQPHVVVIQDEWDMEEPALSASISLAATTSGRGAPDEGAQPAGGTSSLAGYADLRAPPAAGRLPPAAALAAMQSKLDPDKYRQQVALLAWLFGRDVARRATAGG